MVDLSAAPTPTLGMAARAGALRLVRTRSFWVAVAGWLLATAAVVLLGQQGLPFRFAPSTPSGLAYQLASHYLQLAFELFLMVVIALVTWRRVVPDLAARAPASARAALETAGLVAYALLAQAGGWAAGTLLGVHALSLHLPGAIYGPAGPVEAREVYAWAAYNFVVYAAVPYACFRLLGYSNEQLSLRSNDRWRDLLLIGVVLGLESAFELAFNHRLFDLSATQLLLGAPASFVLHVVGTVLPIMVFIYAILLPRYLRLTGSTAATILLGGLTYAAVHALDSWTSFVDVRAGVLSALFVLFQYFGPGMVKSLLTLRTANAWVHAVAYHSIAPHVLLDTPNIVRIFGIR
jgi:hypothetical protein